MSQMYRVEDILSRLDGVRRTANGWVARCPAHDDRTPSLSIGAGQYGEILLYCHTGCSTQAVLDEVGLTWRALFPPRHGSGGIA
jgi:hypothetical protein